MYWPRGNRIHTMQFRFRECLKICKCFMLARAGWVSRLVIVSFKAAAYRRIMSLRALSVVILGMLFAMPLAAQPVPFEVCAESRTWVRPSPEVQSKIWNDPRYTGFARDAYAWTHNFLVVGDPESTNEFGYLSNLSGLWTAHVEENASKCSGSTRRSGYEWIEVWSLLHRVASVTRDANTYTVTVVPDGKGFQGIYIRRMNPSVVLRFVTQDGRELERWDESAPPRPSNNTVPPGTRIVAPNGQVIQK
jgi:hypothetical protein